jgi:acetylglutamate kinase
MGVMARSEIQADDHAIASFRGRTVVVEHGGAAMEQAHLRDGFSRDIAAIRLAGVNPVVVHGGGRRMSRLLEAAERIPRFVGDPRVTPDETMRLVERALATTADEIARLIGRHGVEAVESGVWPGQIVRACRRKPLLPAGESVDLGRVGDVAGVNARPIRALLERGIVPIIGPLGIGADGRTYNIDADLVAGEVAAVLGADLVIYGCSGDPGSRRPPLPAAEPVGGGLARARRADRRPDAAEDRGLRPGAEGRRGSGAARRWTGAPCRADDAPGPAWSGNRDRPLDGSAGRPDLAGCSTLHFW